METSILSAYSKNECQKYFDYLERLRQSGETNMYGAVPYLQEEFPELRYSPERARKNSVGVVRHISREGGGYKMLKPLPDKVQDVLSSPWAQVQRVKRSPQQTDRVLRSTKLEDSIYRDLRMEDTGMDEIENSAGEKAALFPALAGYFPVLYSLMPRRNADDDLSVAARKINVPILEHITQSDDYPTLKEVCEGRELPAYEAATEFVARASGELEDLLTQLGGKPGAMNTLEKLELAEAKAVDELFGLLEQLQRTGQDNPDTERGCDQSRQRGPEQTSAGRSRGETVDASQMQNRATVSGMIQQAVAAAAEKG